jgi:hypothetical protein
MWGVSWPDYAPVNSILAVAHTRKNEELYDTYIKKHKEYQEQKDYLYEIYVKKAHENIIRMEVSMVNTIDFYV